MMKEDDKGNIEWAPWNILMESPDEDFPENNIDLWYYKDPVFKTISSQFAYANEEKPVIIGTDFFWNTDDTKPAGNSVESFRSYATFTCRFTSTTDSSRRIVTPAIMESRPIGEYKKDKKPDQIRCRTPKWGAPDTANVDVSVNGQDYLGTFEYTFVSDL
jgi:hypothetical protein